MKQYLKLKLNQKLSPQQIQLMKLIQLPTIDFEQNIQRELEENPALEIEENRNICMVCIYNFKKIIKIIFYFCIIFLMIKYIKYYYISNHYKNFE